MLRRGQEGLRRDVARINTLLEQWIANQTRHRPQNPPDAPTQQDLANRVQDPMA